MPKVAFDTLPDDARVWVFGAGRTLSPSEESELLSTVDDYLDTWAAHGSPLTCGREWRYGRFLLVGVDERTAPPSGCSIDAMVRVLKGFEERLGTSLIDGSPVWYRHDGQVESVDRAGFRGLAGSGRVGPETIVFDGTVTRAAQLRAGEWERPARDSWHGKVFFKDA